MTDAVDLARVERRLKEAQEAGQRNGNSLTEYWRAHYEADMAVLLATVTRLTEAVGPATNALAKIALVTAYTEPLPGALAGHVKTIVDEMLRGTEENARLLALLDDARKDRTGGVESSMGVDRMLGSQVARAEVAEAEVARLRAALERIPKWKYAHGMYFCLGCEAEKSAQHSEGCWVGALLAALAPRPTPETTP